MGHLFFCFFPFSYSLKIQSAQDSQTWVLCFLTYNRHTQHPQLCSFGSRSTLGLNVNCPISPLESWLCSAKKLPTGVVALALSLRTSLHYKVRSGQHKVPRMGLFMYLCSNRSPTNVSIVLPWHGKITFLNSVKLWSTYFGEHSLNADTAWPILTLVVLQPLSHNTSDHTTVTTLLTILNSITQGHRNWKPPTFKYLTCFWNALSWLSTLVSRPSNSPFFVSST